MEVCSIFSEYSFGAFTTKIKVFPPNGLGSKNLAAAATFVAPLQFLLVALIFRAEYKSISPPPVAAASHLVIYFEGSGRFLVTSAQKKPPFAPAECGPKPRSFVLGVKVSHAFDRNGNNICSGMPLTSPLLQGKKERREPAAPFSFQEYFLSSTYGARCVWKMT